MPVNERTQFGGLWLVRRMQNSKRQSRLRGKRTARRTKKLLGRCTLLRSCRRYTGEYAVYRLPICDAVLFYPVQISDI